MRRVKSRREKRSEIVMETEMKVTRNLMRGLQEVLEATIPSSFLRIRLSINFYQR